MKMYVRFIHGIHTLSTGTSRTVPVPVPVGVYEYVPVKNVRDETS